MKKTVYLKINVIGDIRAIDMTPILLYLYAKDCKSDNTYLSASNFMDVYNSLDGLVDLPDLDADALSMNNPAYTVSKIREVICAPQILSSIESKFTVSSSGLIPINSVKVALTRIK